ARERLGERGGQGHDAFPRMHGHGLGVGMLIRRASIVIVNLPMTEGAKRVGGVLISLGALYRPGWLILGWLIPYWGVRALRTPVEWGLFIPFGGAAIIAIWGTLVLYLIALFRREPRQGERQ